MNFAEFDIIRYIWFIFLKFKSTTGTPSNTSYLLNNSFSAGEKTLILRLHRPRHHPHTKVITSYIIRYNLKTHEWLNEPKLLAAFYEHRLTDTHQCSLTWSHCMYPYIFFLINEMVFPL